MRLPVTGFLAWLFPGLGHVYLGYWKRGLILMVTISVTFWSGVAIGGVRGTVDWRYRKAWFVAQLGTVGNTLAAAVLHKSIGMLPGGEDADGPPGPPYTGHWLSVDVGIHYAGVAGLLNLLAIFDALARADLLSKQRRVAPKALRGG